MAIVVGIDGTGSAVMPGKGRDKQYDVDFSDSFVRRICWKADANYAYFRGPVALGGGLVAAINGGYQFIMDRRKAGVTDHVCLTGYSRGACGVVSMAAKLKRANVKVKAMLLFDCVDRHMFVDAEVVPNNVENLLHLIRDPKAGSRESFGNDGMYYQLPTQARYFKVFCTHGAMGGTPWKLPKGKKMTDKIVESFPDGKTNVTYAQDQQASRRIWQFCQPFLRKHSFIG